MINFYCVVIIFDKFDHQFYFGFFLNSIFVLDLLERFFLLFFDNVSWFEVNSFIGKDILTLQLILGKELIKRLDHGFWMIELKFLLKT